MLTNLSRKRSGDEQWFDIVDDVVERKRLPNETACASHNGLSDEWFAAFGSHHDDGYSGCERFFLDLDDEFESVHHGHVDITHDEVDFVRA